MGISPLDDDAIIFFVEEGKICNRPPGSQVNDDDDDSDSSSGRPEVTLRWWQRAQVIEICTTETLEIFLPQ